MVRPALDRHIFATFAKMSYAAALLLCSSAALAADSATAEKPVLAASGETNPALVVRQNSNKGLKGVKQPATGLFHTFQLSSVGPLVPPTQAKANEPQAAQADGSGPQVRLVGIQTDVARRYKFIIPNLPFPPFTQWRKWITDHEVSVHCAFEWRDELGLWRHGEMRSTHFDPRSEEYRVGWGEFPGTAYAAYGVYINPGRLPRDKDHFGRAIAVTLDEEVKCDYRRIEEELRNYAARYARPGDPGTGGGGHNNVGLGGPAYKPAQNSNTMINYILRRCGVVHSAPELAVGWDRVPHFPYSTDAEMPALDCRP